MEISEFGNAAASDVSPSVATTKRTICVRRRCHRHHRLLRHMVHTAHCTQRIHIIISCISSSLRLLVVVCLSDFRCFVFFLSSLQSHTVRSFLSSPMSAVCRIEILCCRDVVTEVVGVGAYSSRLILLPNHIYTDYSLQTHAHTYHCGAWCIATCFGSPCIWCNMQLFLTHAHKEKFQFSSSLHQKENRTESSLCNTWVL